MDLSPEARLGLCSTRRFGRLVALDEGPSLDLDPTGCLPLPLETPNRLLALPARHSKRTTGLFRVERGFVLSGQALKLAVAPNPSASLGEGQGLGGLHPAVVTVGCRFTFFYLFYFSSLVEESSIFCRIINKTLTITPALISIAAVLISG